MVAKLGDGLAHMENVMNKGMKRHLILKSETVRALSGVALDGVVGGQAKNGGGQQFSITGTTASLPPTSHVIFECITVQPSQGILCPTN